MSTCSHKLQYSLIFNEKFLFQVSLALFIVTLNVCSAQIWSNTCRKISPVKYEDVMLWEDKEDGHDKIYLPEVII